MYKLCDTQFWNVDTSWNTSSPHLTPCFRDTFLAWTPVAFLIIISLPLELYFIASTARDSLKTIPWNNFNILRLAICLLMALVKFIQAVLIIYKTFFDSDPDNVLIPTLVKPFLQTIALTILACLYLRQRIVGRHTSGPIWFFLFIFNICSILAFISYLSDKLSSETIDNYADHVFVPTLIVLFILECRGDTKQTDTTIVSNRPQSPEDKCSFLSTLVLEWFTTFLMYGYRNQLKISSLWELFPRDKSHCLAPGFKKIWHLPPTNKDTKDAYTRTDASLQPKNNIFPVLLKIFGGKLALSALMKVVHDILQFLTPMVFKLVLEFMTSTSPKWHGYLFAFALLFVPLIQSIVSAHYFVKVLVIGQNIKSTLVGAIYRKSLVLDTSSRSQSTTGEIINLMSVDSARIQETLLYLNMVWSAPFQIALAVSLLYRELGYAVFAGVGVMVIIGPINAFISRRIKTIQMKLMKTKDERIKLINEMLNGIKVIKLYAWEKSFMANISDNRRKELEFLRRISIYDSFQTFFWLSSPFLVALVTFTTYILSDSSHQLTPVKVFVSISLLNLLRFPLAMLPMVVNSIVLAAISSRRVTRFLNMNELVKYVKREESSEAIAIEGASLAWTSNPNTQDDTRKPAQQATYRKIDESPSVNSSKDFLILKDIDMHIKRGSFVAIVGQVASGKSSLISCILGEMHKISGKINVAKGLSIAYVPQQAWIQNMTVKENIIFGNKYDDLTYRQTIDSCALQPDLESFPNGDQSEVGESGLNLSGGQKQRLSLARALYSMSDIYLFDDPLSALDSHIAKHVFDKVLSSTTGSLRQKTRVLATNSLFVLPYVDYIYVLLDGRIVEKGSYSELMSITDGRLKATLSEQSSKAASTANSPGVSQPDDTQASSKTASRQISISSEQESIASTPPEDKALNAHIDSSALHKTISQHITHVDKISKQSSIESSQQKQSDGKLIEEEHLQTGSVDIKVYFEYFKAVSIFWVVLVILFLVSSTSFQVATNFWLSQWTSKKSSTSYSLSTRLIVYGLLGLFQCLSTLFGLFSLSQAIVTGSMRLHSWLLESIMHSPTTTFFDVAPIGRIVNRFAKDIDVVDSALPAGFRSLLECTLSILATIFVICYSFPTFLIIVIPIAILYLLVQRVFIRTIRQLKRLESITRSPIYSNFGETLSGIGVIRAYGVEERFIKQSDSLLDNNVSCSYPNVIANRWLSTRLEFFGNALSCFVALYAVYMKGSTDPGLVGLAISYSLGITQTLSWFVRMSSDLETNIVSVERILEYINNKPEDEWTKESFTPPTPDWPDKGVIKFEDYSAKYRSEMSLVLRKIEFNVGSCEKVGIVGRTGSGKTSLSLALFRMLQNAGGHIVIDGVDIATCGLHDLRSRLTIIPQDSVLFSGSLRFNLDPLQLYSDEQIWRSLELSHLKPYVSGLTEGLDFKVSEFGGNFSHGQRQLVCLARAILRNSKIIILDEATAAVDADTDKLIQKTIRVQFKNSTILTIAHRLETILDSDKILVLDSGRVQELDTPYNLAANQASIFASLLKAAKVNTKLISNPSTDN